MTEEKLLQVIEKAARDKRESLDLSRKGLKSLPAEIGKLTNLTSLNLYNNQLTNLPAEIGNLTNLTSLDLWSNQLTNLPAEIGNLTNLTSLDLRNNQLTNLPAEFGKLTNLTSLNLEDNQLTNLPAEIGNLTNLTSLNLEDNQLTNLPAEIGNLTNLTSLALRNNQLTNLPAEIGNLTNLTSLDLRNNQLTNLPAEFGNLTNLTSLYLSRNQLTNLPAEFGNLTNLTSLNLWSNQLTNLPAEIGKLTNLTSLDLWSNQLTNLPAEIGKLTNLTSLDLSYNQLTNLPAEFGNLTNLTSLDLRNNQLTNLPAEFGNLTNLTSLNLRNNQLTNLPAEFGKLTNLTSLNLEDNQLTNLPAEFGKLTNLTSLNLEDNQLTNLPAEFGKLTNLTSLNLEDNQLTNLPAEIAKLTNLTSLNLSNNQLTNLPAEIGKLTNLTSLDLENNQLTNLPAEIGKLTNLTSLALSIKTLKKIPAHLFEFTNITKLNLSANELTNIPPDIAKLTNLTSLDISNNKLTKLPKEISQLSNLRDLALRDNQFKTLPAEIRLLPLQRLTYGNNPLESPPTSIRKKGTKEILNYLKQQLEQNTDYLYEAKLLIIGEAGAGKTTLAQKIQDSNYELKSDEDSTEGIDVIQWHFPLDNARDFRINIWDFGGQEIYHETHQFFLTERSLYTLVADTRKEDTNFYWWLKVVELLSNNSPVLVIKNERQERKRDINERQLRGEFTNFKETFATNFATNRGLPEILNTIQHYISNLPHIGEGLPAYWVKVREVLEKDSRNYMSFDEYLNICQQQGFKRLEDKLQLSGYFHDLGVFLHFQNDDLLKKTIILNTAWGTDAVYKVLDNETVKKNFGKFASNDLKNIWNEEKYMTMHGELLRLMMNFKLCYEIPSQPGNYIAPQLLSTEQPEYNWDETNNLLLRYEYEFMPKGILTRFIVETHAMIENETCVWKTGVVLNKDGARAEIIELYRYHKGEIRVRVTGNRKRDLLTTVRHELDKIHKSYERLKYKTLVPCNCSKCKGSQSPDFYPWDMLNRYIDDKEPTIKCNNSYAMVNVQGLVNDIVQPDVFTLDNKEENLMSDQRTFIFNAPTQFNEKNQGEANQHNYTSDPSIKNAIAEIRDILNKLNNKHPNINETEATEIIQAEFTEIQTTQPQKWKIIKQVFDGKRWVNGSKQAIIKVGEHYTENSVLGKGLIGFAEGFTEDE